MEPQKKNERRSYILRLWRSDKDEQWRIMLQAVDDKKARHFATMSQFVAFLEEIDAR